jgi:hypothetical protein
MDFVETDQKNVVFTNTYLACAQKGQLKPDPRLTDRRLKRVDIAYGT